MTYFNQLRLDSKVDRKYYEENELEKVTVRGKAWRDGNILIVKSNFNLFSKESIKALTLQQDFYKLVPNIRWVTNLALTKSHIYFQFHYFRFALLQNITFDEQGKFKVGFY